MRNDFFNEKRKNRENDRENFNFNQIFKVCYNCKSFEHLFNKCIKFHVLDFILTS